jgi:ribonuclease-3 family protein
MDQMNGLSLAYMGDAVYETMVREYLMNKGFQKVEHLHKEAVKFTNAAGQERAFHLIESHLTEEEVSLFKRGRNAKTERKARSASIASYKKATGLESLFGALYLQKQTNRLEELFQIIVRGFQDET